MLRVVQWCGDRGGDASPQAIRRERRAAFGAAVVAGAEVVAALAAQAMADARAPACAAEEPCDRHDHAEAGERPVREPDLPDPAIVGADIADVRMVFKSMPREILHAR